jgi:hypothetical protein
MLIEVLEWLAISAPPVRPLAVGTGHIQGFGLAFKIVDLSEHQQGFGAGDEFVRRREFRPIVAAGIDPLTVERSLERCDVRVFGAPPPTQESRQIV